MILRQNRVKMWLEDIANDIDNINKIFSLNLISENDIGKIYHKNIIQQLQTTSTIIDEILFNLESK